MNFFHRIPVMVALAGALAVAPATMRARAPQPSASNYEAAARLQVFLDRGNFSPGKIDGRYGEFTVKALALYREAHGEVSATPPPESAKIKSKGTKSEAAPNVSGLDLASVDPVFKDYTVQADDLKSIGPVPSGIPEQAKLKALPYRDAAEAIAEKFHTDAKFLALLNPGTLKSIKAGDVLHVPNVEPFELAAVKDLQPGSEIEGKGANDVDIEPAPKGKRDKGDAKSEAASAIRVQVDVKANMLKVFEAEKLVAAYPVTIGSAQLESPIGDWKVRGIAKMPNFRYDKEMLNHGRRSGDFHLLPPGPNNPVGVMWIQLNKKGIGLHGTNEPETIGRASSHGCVRLANWDVVRLAAKIQAGVAVSIR